jgi:CpeT protein
MTNTTNAAIAMNNPGITPTTPHCRAGLARSSCTIAVCMISCTALTLLAGCAQSTKSDRAPEPARTTEAVATQTPPQKLAPQEAAAPVSGPITIAGAQKPIASATTPAAAIATTTPVPTPAAVAPTSPALTRLAELMTGQFSSRAQAAADPEFFDIRLFMVEIWPGQPDGSRWLYVEQARADVLERPYRQRVYKLSARPDGSLQSEVFTLPGDALAFAGAWKSPDRFARINPQSLMLRDGCAIILRAESADRYTGSTVGNACPSELRGAKYATSEVVITPIGMDSWDRGYDAADKQVWGAEKGGYQFRRDPDAATPAPKTEPKPTPPPTKPVVDISK